MDVVLQPGLEPAGRPAGRLEEGAEVRHRVAVRGGTAQGSRRARGGRGEGPPRSERDPAGGHAAVSLRARGPQMRPETYGTTTPGPFDCLKHLWSAGAVTVPSRAERSAR